MTDNTEPTFEPFLTISLGTVRQAYQSYGETKIAINSNAPGVTAIHWYDAPAARRLVADLNTLIDKLDPPLAGPVPVVVTDKHLGPQRAKRIRRGKPAAKRKAKKK